MKKITTDDFIKCAIKIHNNLYDYSKSNYVNAKTKLCIICKKHGEFLQIPYGHLSGRGCRKCSTEKTHLLQKSNTIEFINKAKKIHGDRYNYNKVNYINAYTDVIITCKEHGDFLQTPTSHLNGSNCLKCIYSYPRTINEFIKQANSIHNNKYSYSESYYKNIKDKIIIKCNVCGNIFHQQANLHLMGSGCNKCAILNNSTKRKKSFEEWISGFNNIHKNKYYYYKQDINCKTKVKIKCHIHGDFYQNANIHNLGGGCKLCSYQYNSYKKEQWVKKAKNREGIFYIIKCFNDNEIFYKCGITFNSIKYRYRNKDKQRMPYNYEIIRQIKSNNLEYIWDLEKRFINIKKKKKYFPLISFAGSKNECFTNLKLKL